MLVTDAEGRATLAACRALHGAGYRVSTVATERPALSHWSRCNDERLLAPNPRETVSGFGGRLAEIVAAGRYDAVLAGSDASLVAISEHRAALEPHTRLGLPSCGVVERTLDKVALLEAAETADLAAPRSVVCTSEADAVAHAAEIGFPVILKPARSFLRIGDALTQRTPKIARTPADIEALAPGIGSPFVLQRYEEDTSILSCSGVLAHDALLAFVVARYERTWPVEAGPSSSSRTIEPAAGLPARVLTLVRALGWQGIFQLQLLELRGRLATLDFNARLFGSLELAVAAGANLPALWVSIVLGDSPRPVEARSGVHYRWEEGDLRHLVWQLRRGRLRDAGRVVVPRRGAARAYFRATDPAPLAAAIANAVGRRRRRRG